MNEAIEEEISMSKARYKEYIVKGQYEDAHWESGYFSGLTVARVLTKGRNDDNVRETSWLNSHKNKDKVE